MAKFKMVLTTVRDVIIQCNFRKSKYNVPRDIMNGILNTSVSRAYINVYIYICH